MSSGKAAEPPDSIKGGWSLDEHIRFLKGLQVFGPVWKHVQYAVKSRSVLAIQAHGTSYISRQNKNLDNKRKRSIHDVTLTQLKEAEEALGTNEGFVWEPPPPNEQVGTGVATVEKKKRGRKVPKQS